jgi:glycosyltransferase involved in cell wall biosynthesis
MLNWRDPKNPKAGGAERVTLGYLADLVERGHEVWWFSHDFPGAQPQEVVDGVKIIRGGGVFTCIRHAVRWYRQQPPFDLVIDQHHGIPWFAPWWCRTNCVSYIHEVLGPIWKSFYPFPVSVIGQFQERWTQYCYRNIPFWTACQGTQTCLQRNGVRQVKMIPYGVHTQALEQLEPKTIAAPVRLVVVSRLAPNKRIDHAVRTVRVLQDRAVPCHMEVVGDGAEMGKLVSLVKQLGIEKQVSFLGSLSEEEKDQVLRRSHLLLHTSVREGWGLNVIEANAMGTPTVVYPVPGLIESTLHEQTGLVSEMESPESLADRIVQLLKSPERYQQYRVNAWERAKTFHWSRILPVASDWLEAQAGRSPDKPRK